MKRPAIFLIASSLVLMATFGASGCTLLGLNKNGNSSTESGKKAAKKDVAGKDLEGFPRYPDSLRTYFGEGKDAAGRNVIRVNYSVTQPADTIVMWFKNELAKQGKAPFSDAGSPSNKETLVFSLNGRTITLTIQYIDSKQSWIVVEEASDK